jgi:hypothetical protein
MKNWTVFANVGYAAETMAMIYTVPAGNTAIIDKCSSYSAAGGSLTLMIVPPGQTPSAANVIYTKTFAPGESYLWAEMVGQELVAGDMIYEDAGAAGTVTRRISGRVGS